MLGCMRQHSDSDTAAVNCRRHKLVVLRKSQRTRGLHMRDLYLIKLINPIRTPAALLCVPHAFVVESYVMRQIGRRPDRVQLVVRKRRRAGCINIAIETQVR